MGVGGADRTGAGTITGVGDAMRAGGRAAAPKDDGTIVGRGTP